ncbi:MAG: hypothetical protein ACKOEM_00375, partial [Planctomycetia bacterium]
PSWSGAAVIGIGVYPIFFMKSVFHRLIPTPVPLGWLGTGFHRAVFFHDTITRHQKCPENKVC